jgi:molybdopterin-binding protein
MPDYRLADAARLLGVSDDTLRRWVDAGRLASHAGADGRRTVDGAELAAFAVALAGDPAGSTGSSARNRFPGLVTRVVRGEVVSQVEVQAGPHRLVSVVTTESVDDLGLAPGVMAVATVKALSVAVELA